MAAAVGLWHRDRVGALDSRLASIWEQLRPIAESKGHRMVPSSDRSGAVLVAACLCGANWAVGPDGPPLSVFVDFDQRCGLGG